MWGFYYYAGSNLHFSLLISVLIPMFEILLFFNVNADSFLFWSNPTGRKYYQNDINATFDSPIRGKNKIVS